MPGTHPLSQNALAAHSSDYMSLFRGLGHKAIDVFRHLAIRLTLAYSSSLQTATPPLQFGAYHVGHAFTLLRNIGICKTVPVLPNPDIESESQCHRYLVSYTYPSSPFS